MQRIYFTRPSNPSGSVTHLPLHKGGSGAAPFFGGPMMMRRSRCHGPRHRAHGERSRAGRILLAYPDTEPRGRGRHACPTRQYNPLHPRLGAGGRLKAPPTAFGYFRPDESDNKTRACQGGEMALKRIEKNAIAGMAFFYGSYARTRASPTFLVRRRL